MAGPAQRAERGRLVTPILVTLALSGKREKFRPEPHPTPSTEPTGVRTGRGRHHAGVLCDDTAVS